MEPHKIERLRRALFRGLTVPLQCLGGILVNTLAQAVEQAQFRLGVHNALLCRLGQLGYRHPGNQIIAGTGVFRRGCLGGIERITVAFIHGQLGRAIGCLVNQEQGLDIILCNALAR